MRAGCWLRCAPFLAALLLGCALPSSAQIITTIAGNALYDRSPATQTPLNWPSGIAVDSQGNFWIADTSNHVIRRVDAATGESRIIAGGGPVADPLLPVPATSAILEMPTFVVRGRAGNVYFCETARHRVRKISPDGMLTTVAGTGQAGFSGDGGLATRATLSFPEGLVLDAAGNLYITDRNNGRVRRVDAASGIITTAAGGGIGGDGGPATSAGLSVAPGLAFDRGGNLYIASGGPLSVKRVDAGTGIITTIAGGGSVPCCTPGQSGPATSFSLPDVYGLLLDRADNLYLAGGGRLVRVEAATAQMTVLSFLPDFYSAAWAFDSSGNILATTRGQGRVLRVDPASGTSTLAGGTSDPLDGPLALAAVSTIQTITSDGRSSIYLCDRAHESLRKVDLTAGQISTTGSACSGLALDSQGIVYTSRGLQVRRVNPVTGASTLAAGTGERGFSGDGGPGADALQIIVS